MVVTSVGRFRVRFGAGAPLQRPVSARLSFRGVEGVIRGGGKYRNVGGLLRTAGGVQHESTAACPDRTDWSARCRTVTCGDGLRWMGCLLMAYKRSGIRISIAPLPPARQNAFPGAIRVARCCERHCGSLVLPGRLSTSRAEHGLHDMHLAGRVPLFQPLVEDHLHGGNRGGSGSWFPGRG